MTRLYIIIILTLTFTISGCGDSACYKQLVEVDSLTENDLTDSAGKVIQAIENTYNIREGKERAYYSLLKYQLQFRQNYINKNVHVEDSLIKYSISYYSDNEDAQKLALAYYLKGRMSKNKEAIRYLKKAEFVADKTNDNFLKMRICGSISTINVNNENYNTALVYGLKSIEYGKKANDIETLIRYMLNLSSVYDNIDNSDSCIYYANKCISYIDKVPLAQKASIYINVAAALENTDTAKAKEYALKSLETRKSNNAYQILAYLARKRNDYTLSEKYLEEAIKYSKSIDWDAAILYELADTKKVLGKFEEANELSTKVIRLRDSVEFLKAQDSIREIQMAAELENRKQSEIKAKDNDTAMIVGALTLVIAAVFAAYIMKRRKYNKSVDDIANMGKNIASMEKDMETMEKDMETMGKDMETMGNDIKRLKEENKEKDKDIKAAGKEMRKQLEKQKKEAEKTKRKESELYQKGYDIYNKVKNGTKVQGWDNEMMKAIITFYTAINPDFKKQTEKTYTALTEYQYTILIMKDMAVSNKQIAEYFGTKDSAIRTMISRIKRNPSPL